MKRCADIRLLHMWKYVSLLSLYWGSVKFHAISDSKERNQTNYLNTQFPRRYQLLSAHDLMRNSIIFAIKAYLNQFSSDEEPDWRSDDDDRSSETLERTSSKLWTFTCDAFCREWWTLFDNYVGKSPGQQLIRSPNRWFTRLLRVVG